MARSERARELDRGRLVTIEAKLAGYIAEGRLPGATFLVAQHGRTLYRAALGLKDIATGEPLANDTICRLFSMTKPVTAVAMMTLLERGLWQPEDPIALHLPEFAEVKGPGGAPPDHPPTMRELMTHTAGFGHGVGRGPFDPTDAAYDEARIWEAENLADLTARVAMIPLAYQPGSAWRYSLSADLQGAIIERLTGRSLPAFMRETLFAPLGMADTGFALSSEQLPRLATLYHMYRTDRLTEVDNPFLIHDPMVAPGRPSGGAGLYSTLGDYARFAQMLANGGSLDGVQILTPVSVAMMTTNHLSPAIIEAGARAGAQKIGPGRGFGFGGAVFFDPDLAGAPVGKGTYQWDGASGVWFWIDPRNDLAFVGMTQRMWQPRMPQLQAETQACIAAALG